MDRFLKEKDYQAVLRDEIKDALMEGYTDTKLYTAEDMAMDQIKGYIGGRYNVKDIFSKRDAERNSFIVMIIIDCTLYHLYSAESLKISDTRSTRYDDALKWLQGVGEGKIKPNLPLIKDEDGKEKTDFIIRSRKLNNNKY